MKSVREAEEFIVHPSDVKALMRGEALSISRVVDPRWGIVNIPRASSFGESRIEEFRENLLRTRESYLTAGNEKFLSLPASLHEAAAIERPVFSLQDLR